MSLHVDQSCCIGCGSCSAIAPKTFKVNKDGKSQVIDSNGDSAELIEQAIDNCPVNCISK